MNHMRLCAVDNGNRAGRGIAVTRGTLRPRPDTRAARSRTDGASNRSPTDTSTSSRSATRAATRAADSELPPRSKNDCVTLTRSAPSTSATMAAIEVSASDSGAANSSTVSSGTGSLRRATLPALFSGSCSSAIHTVGRM